MRRKSTTVSDRISGRSLSGDVVVVDVGCMPHGREESVNRLIVEYAPTLLFGFDPHPDLVEGVERIGSTLVVRRRAAAWVSSGEVSLLVDGIMTGVEWEQPGQPRVPSVDLAAFLRALPTGEIVLKIDAEGAEYPLLAKLARTGVDERLALVLVEWHPPETAHGWYRAERPVLSCPVREW